MNFDRAVKYVVDRPFLMALIIFVTLFLIYNFFFKNKTTTSASTVAAAALPTSGRGTMFNREFRNPAGPTPAPVPTPVPVIPTPPPILPQYPQSKSIRSGSGKGAYIYGVPNNQSVVIAYQPFGSAIQVTGPTVSGPINASFWPVAGGYIQTTDVV